MSNGSSIRSGCWGVATFFERPYGTDSKLFTLL